MKSWKRWGKKKNISLATKDAIETYQIPWHAEVEEGDQVELIYTYEKEEQEPKIVLNLYNRTNQNTEVDEKFPKPEKGIVLALLDFVLLICLGLAASPIIADTFHEKGTFSGLLVLFGMIIVIYFLIQKITYQLFFKRHLEDIEHLDSYVQNQQQKS